MNSDLKQLVEDLVAQKTKELNQTQPLEVVIIKKDELKKMVEDLVVQKTKELHEIEILEISRLKREIKTSKEEYDKFTNKINSSVKELIITFKSIASNSNSVSQELEDFKSKMNNSISDLKNLISNGNITIDQKLISSSSDKNIDNNINMFIDDNKITIENKEDVSQASKPIYNIEDLPYLYYCKGSHNGCQGQMTVVYGTNPYTDDSGKCRAALHSGLITEDGGYFLIKPGGRMANFGASNNNNVTTNFYGPEWNSQVYSQFFGPGFGTIECGKVNI